ncbi:flagellar hook-length control protein FliK [Zoogloea sp.]|uniref:flagellar hook-length control protein FliK n=1 Tax=Zoogloea sp. TaxID=49181 RepID=UPI0026372611|nr:flagellar hook-length control protein FliK [Zoogloea sp.]MDD3352513.1 flagellar hook-length control protein FliK [Zoogloea sp.]
MIPGDLATRLRMLTEASFFSTEPNLAPLARVKAISANLPEFSPGERITATIQRANQDQTFQGRVNGKDVILSMNQPVKAGDTLELVVTQVTPRGIVATLANPPPPAANQAALSQTGKLISFLLTGQPAAEGVRLNGGQPLQAAPPQSGAPASQLAGALSSAVAQSGLFYEAHQARWLAGQLDTAALRLEPQGREAALPRPPVAGAGVGASPAAATPASPAAGAAATTPGTLPALPPSLRPGEAALSTQVAGGGIRPDTSGPVAERLVPLVHQQLDAVASHQIAWQGQVWPGQFMEWEIEDPEGDGSHPDDPESTWNTTLRLTLPRLGGVEARLHLTPAGVALRLITDQEETRTALQAGQARLAEALAAANVPLTGLVAERKADVP